MMVTTTTVLESSPTANIIIYTMKKTLQILQLFKVGWILIGCQCIYGSAASSKIDIVNLCCYSRTFFFKCTILISFLPQTGLYFAHYFFKKKNFTSQTTFCFRWHHQALLFLAPDHLPLLQYATPLLRSNSFWVVKSSSALHCMSCCSHKCHIVK